MNKTKNNNYRSGTLAKNGDHVIAKIGDSVVAGVLEDVGQGAMGTATFKRVGSSLDQRPQIGLERCHLASEAFQLSEDQPDKNNPETAQAETEAELKRDRERQEEIDREEAARQAEIERERLAALPKAGEPVHQ